MPEPSGQAVGEKQRHVSVVFFHGIGQQRHYESTAHLIDAIDDWVFSQHRRADPDHRQPRLHTKTRRELLRGSDKKDEAVAFIQADYDGTRVRFYEAYWAPAAVLGTTARSAFLWLMRQLPRPLSVLTASWRSYARLRRGDLLRLAGSKILNSPQELSTGGDIRSLVTLFREFVARRERTLRGFNDFLKFLRDNTPPASRSHFISLARKWRWFHVRTELWHLATLALIGLSIVAGGILLLVSALSLLGTLPAIPFASRVAAALGIEANLQNSAALIALLFSAVGVRSFFRDFIGDIQQFVTYEEAQPLHERRQMIIDEGVKMLRHVLLDNQCDRVVLVAHSLGTSIALDAVLGLRAANQAANPEADADIVMRGPIPLMRIQHFVTCGSPIDKINYFFATLRSATRSYESLIEDLRGDIGSVPFSKSGRQPYVHWMNFWDQGDPISGPIETVAGDIVRDQRVDNIRIASLGWPDPASSHGAYFRHRHVIRTVFRAAFRNELSFSETERDPRGRPLWPWIGPGTASLLQTMLLGLVPMVSVLLVWSAIGAIAPSLIRPPFGWFGILTGILLLGALIQKRCGLHLDPVI